MAKPRRVAVLIETDDSWGRSLVASIASYARENQWRLLIAPRDHQHRLRLPKKWQGDGVLVSLRDRSMVDHVRRSRLPAVDVSIMMPKSVWIGRVATDDAARARMAFEHFRERQLENFACYAPAIGRYPIARANAFRDVVTAEGFSCNVFAQRGETQGWEVDHDHVVDWLAKLPRPLAVFAADPYPARQLAEICELNAIAVPEEVAILSGDNDDLLCSVSSPQLSSIQLACGQIGIKAATLLTKLMSGGKVPSRPTLVPPLYVSARRSTDVLAIEDSEIVAILRYMADNIQQSLSVAEVLKQFPISRRSLEQKFRKQLNRSPAEHIRHLRMEHVTHLLKETDLTITEIAYRAGFNSSSSLTQQIQRHAQMSPTSLRAKFRE